VPGPAAARAPRTISSVISCVVLQLVTTIRTFLRPPR
jgi:hypothetical protein